jgi:hypothetical protein
MVCTTPIATSTTTAATTTTAPMTTRKTSGNANKLRKRSRKDDDDGDDKEVGNGLMAMNEQLRTMVVEWLTEKSAAQLPHPESGGGHK